MALGRARRDLVAKVKPCRAYVCACVCACVGVILHRKSGTVSLSNPSLGGVGGSNSLVVSTAISRLIIITIITYIYVSEMEFGTNTSGRTTSNPLGKLV